jgi:hypothetical protein
MEASQSRYTASKSTAPLPGEEGMKMTPPKDEQREEDRFSREEFF